MAVDDNSPKTGEPQAPSDGGQSASGADEMMNTSMEKPQMGIAGLQTQRGGGGGRRKQCRPMRLVCSLIDTVDPQSEDDTAALPGPPSMTADYPDSAEYCIQSSPPLSDDFTDLAFRRRHHTCDTCGHTAVDESDLIAHCRLAHGRKSSSSNDRRLRGMSSSSKKRPSDAVDSSNTVEMLDAEVSIKEDEDDDLNGEVVEFPTRYHRLGSELKREVETADTRLERIHADAVRKSKSSTNDGHRQLLDGADTDAGYSYPAQQPHYRSRHQENSSAVDSSYGTPLDFTVSSRSTNANSGISFDSQATNRQVLSHQHAGSHQHVGPLVMTSSSGASFTSDLSTSSGLEQSQHGGYNHHHHHHQHYSSSSSQQSHHRPTGAEPPTSVASGGVSSTPVESEDYCDRCQKHFCNKYYLRKHRQDVHGISPANESSTSSANMSSAQQQLFTPSGYPSVSGSAATVQQLLQQQHQQANIGENCSSPVPSSSAVSGQASLLPYQQLINSLPFILPYQQQVGLPVSSASGSIMSSSGSHMFQHPLTSINSSSAAGMQLSSADASSAAAGAMGQAGLLPGLTSLMLLNPFALLNAPSFLQSQAAMAAGLAAAAGMNLAASSSLNSLAELQKSGGIGARGLFPGSIDEASLSLAGLLPPFLGGSGGLSEHQSSLISPPPSSQQQPTLSGTAVDDFSSSPSSTSSSTASFSCDLCRKDFCSQYFLAVHRRDKHGISSAAAGDAPASLTPSTSSTSSQAAAALRLPSTALSDTIRLLAATNGRPPFDGAGLMSDEAEPGEKISSSSGRLGKSMPSNEKPSSTFNASGGRGSSAGSLDRLCGQLLGTPPTGLTSSGGPDDVCCLCKKQFPNRYGLVLHLLSAHNIQPEGFGLAGELLQLDGLLSASGLGLGQQPLTTTSAGNLTLSGRTISRNSTSNVGSMSLNLAPSNGGNGQQTGNASGSNSSKQSDRVSCDICNKEVCNKYFLKTHKIKVHGVDSSVAGQYVPPQQDAIGRSDMHTSSPPADSKSGRTSGGSSGISLKHEEMRKGLMLADSQLNSFAAHLDLTMKKDSFGLAGLGFGSLGLGAPPGSDHQSAGLHLPPPSMSASDLFRLFSAVGAGAGGGKSDDPFGLSAAFGLGPAMRSLGLPELTDQLAATMAAAAAGSIDGRSRSASSSVNDLNIPKHSSSSSMNSSYYKDTNVSNSASSSTHSGLKSKMTLGSSSGKHSSKEPNQLFKSSSSSALNVTSSSSVAVISSQSSSANLLPSSDRPPMTEQELIQSGIDPEAYCELCQKEFCSKYFLRTHRQKIHGVVYGAGKSTSTSAAERGGGTSSSGGGVDSWSSIGGGAGGMVVGGSGGVFEHYRSLAAASNAAAGLSSLGAGSALPMLPLFQGLSLPPVPFCTAPQGVGPQLMLPPDATGLLNSAADAIASASHAGLNMNQSTNSRSSGSREAANATRVTCEVCGKELCNKYFLKTHMAKIHGTPSSTSSTPNTTSSTARDHGQQQLQPHHSTFSSPSTSVDAATYQQADSLENRMQMLGAALTSSSSSHELDLMAPSAFQSLLSATSGSRGSPSTPTSGHKLQSENLAIPLKTENGIDGDLKQSVTSLSSALSGRPNPDETFRRIQLGSSSSSGVKSEAFDDSIVTEDGGTSTTSHHAKSLPSLRNEVCSEEDENTENRSRNGDDADRRLSTTIKSIERDDRGKSALKRKPLRSEDCEDRHSKKSRSEVDGEQRNRLPTSPSTSSPSSSVTAGDCYSFGGQPLASLPSLLSADKGLLSSVRGTGIGNPVDFLQHQLLLSKLANELHSRSLTDIAPDREGEVADSKMPVSALLQRHLHQQQQMLLQQRQFPTYCGGDRASPISGVYDLPQVTRADGVPTLDGTRSRRNDVDDSLQRFLSSSSVPFNGHSSTGGGNDVDATMTVGNDERHRSSSSSSGADSGSERGSAPGEIPSPPPCRLYVPPVGRSGRDQVGIDFSLTASGRSTTSQQAD